MILIDVWRQTGNYVKKLLSVEKKDTIRLFFWHNQLQIIGSICMVIIMKKK